MRWIRFNWHAFWLNYHIQLMVDALGSDERSRQHMKMIYHQMKLTKLICE